MAEMPGPKRFSPHIVYVFQIVADMSNEDFVVTSEANP